MSRILGSRLVGDGGNIYGSFDNEVRVGMISQSSVLLASVSEAVDDGGEGKVGGVMTLQSSKHW